MDTVEAGGLSVAKALYDFMNDEDLPETGLAVERFWDGLGAIIRGFAPRNRKLLDLRDTLQARIDDLRLEAAQWLVERGYGKAPQQITGPKQGPLQVEYHSFDEVRAVLLTKGIDYDRLPLPRMIEHQINNNATKNGNGEH